MKVFLVCLMAYMSTPIITGYYKGWMDNPPVKMSTEWQQRPIDIKIARKLMKMLNEKTPPRHYWIQIVKEYRRLKFKDNHTLTSA